MSKVLVPEAVVVPAKYEFPATYNLYALYDVCVPMSSVLFATLPSMVMALPCFVQNPSWPLFMFVVILTM